MDLQGVTVLVTRPEHQAGGMIRRLEASGAKVVAIPAIRIEPLTHTETPDYAAYDLLFFVSRNAVEYCSLQPGETQARVAAIGKQTARALVERGFKVDCVPEHGFTSEDLLALAELQNLEGKRCLIIRGAGGRQALKQTLEQRGADVGYQDLYRRVGPEAVDPRELSCLVNSVKSVVMFTSVESAENFTKALPETALEWFGQRPMVVGSQRIANRLKDFMGFQCLIVAKDPSDDAMFSALLEWVQQEAETQWQ